MDTPREALAKPKIILATSKLKENRKKLLFVSNRNKSATAPILTTISCCLLQMQREFCVICKKKKKMVKENKNYNKTCIEIEFAFSTAICD